MPVGRNLLVFVRVVNPDGKNSDARPKKTGFARATPLKRTGGAGRGSAGQALAVCSPRARCPAAVLDEKPGAPSPEG